MEELKGKTEIEIIIIFKQNKKCSVKLIWRTQVKV